MDRTEIATNARTAVDNLGETLDQLEGVVSHNAEPSAPAALAASADQLARIFGYDGDDMIDDAVTKAVDKLLIVAMKIVELAEAKLTIDRADMLDPSLEYLRLLRDAEDGVAKGDGRDRTAALLNIADRYLADALRTAYLRRNENEPAKATLRQTDADPVPAGMADLRVPEDVAHALMGLRGAVVAGRDPKDYVDRDVDRDVTLRLTQASALHAVGVTPAALAVFLQIAANGRRVRAVDVESLNAALNVDPTDPRATRADFDDSLPTVERPDTDTDPAPTNKD